MTKILVVDDDPDVPILIEAALENHGFETRATSTPAESLDLAIQESVDAVVLDVNMPGLSGFEVLEALRADPRTADLPVLFLSSRAETSDRVAGLRHGADDYLVKPFELEELYLRMERLVATRKPRPTASQGGVSADVLHQALADGEIKGIRLGRYELIDVLGRGAMGVVARAWDPALRRQVAVKTLLFERQGNHELDQLIDELLHEAMALARFNHPNVISVFDVEHTEEMAYLVIELVKGATLAELLSVRGRLSIRESVAIGLAICRALGVAHGASIVHCDIKPDNILLSHDSSIKVTDFGISNLYSRSEKVRGTPGFLAPEILEEAPPSPPIDVFALGSIIYLCLTGKNPFAANNMYQMLYLTAHKDPDTPHDLVEGMPEAFSALVMEMLQKDPALRPTGSEAIEERLLEVWGSEPQWNFQRSMEGLVPESQEEEHFPTVIIDPKDVHNRWRTPSWI